MVIEWWWVSWILKDQRSIIDMKLGETQTPLVKLKHLWWNYIMILKWFRTRSVKHVCCLTVQINGLANVKKRYLCFFMVFQMLNPLYHPNMLDILRQSWNLQTAWFVGGKRNPYPPANRNSYGHRPFPKGVGGIPASLRSLVTKNSMPNQRAC